MRVEHVGEEVRSLSDIGSAPQELHLFVLLEGVLERVVYAVDDERLEAHERP